MYLHRFLGSLFYHVTSNIIGEEAAAIWIVYVVPHISLYDLRCDSKVIRFLSFLFFPVSFFRVLVYSLFCLVQVSPFYGLFIQYKL